MCGLFGLIALLLCSNGLSDHDLLMPLNLKMSRPGDDVPVNCARFYSESGWGGGDWNGGRPHELYVISVQADCTALVCYGYGGWNHDGTGDWFSLRAEILSDRLVVLIPEHTAVAPYAISADGMNLSGVWEKNDGSSTAYVTLKRLE